MFCWERPAHKYSAERPAQKCSVERGRLRNIISLFCRSFTFIVCWERPAQKCFAERGRLRNVLLRGRLRNIMLREAGSEMFCWERPAQKYSAKRPAQKHFAKRPAQKHTGGWGQKSDLVCLFWWYDCWMSVISKPPLAGNVTHDALGHSHCASWCQHTLQHLHCLRDNNLSVHPKSLFNELRRNVYYEHCICNIFHFL